MPSICQFTSFSDLAHLILNSLKWALLGSAPGPLHTHSSLCLGLSQALVTLLIISFSAQMPPPPRGWLQLLGPHPTPTHVHLRFQGRMKVPKHSLSKYLIEHLPRPSSFYITAVIVFCTVISCPHDHHGAPCKQSLSLSCSPLCLQPNSQHIVGTHVILASKPPFYVWGSHSVVWPKAHGRELTGLRYRLQAPCCP